MINKKNHLILKNSALHLVIFLLPKIKPNPNNNNKNKNYNYNKIIFKMIILLKIALFYILTKIIIKINLLLNTNRILMLQQNMLIIHVILIILIK